MKVVIITLGCKVNQYESDAIAESLRKEKYEVGFNLEPADFYILNTCAVTNEAERKSRQYISKFNKLNPKAKILVVGCASQNNNMQFYDLPNVKYIGGNSNKLKILERINKLSGKANKTIEKLPDFYENISLSTSTNTRAYIKIQDGCNRFCSYCLIPYLRGRSRSRDILSILNEADLLVKNGALELVLTGIDMSDYKIDDEPGLLKLLQQLDAFGVRLRLSSIEMNVLTDDFIGGLSKLKNFCPHFHLSMQSGSTSVLKRMNRKYTAEEFIKVTKKIRKKFKDATITTDLIVGFAGETDAEFKETVKTLKKIKFAYVHMFPYSRRSGTAADKLINLKTNPDFYMVDGNIVKERIKILQEINKNNFIAFNKKQIGKLYEIIIEEAKDGYWIGHSKNFVKVYIPVQKNGNLTPNKLITVKALSLNEKTNDGVIAEQI